MELLVFYNPDLDSFSKTSNKNLVDLNPNTNTDNSNIRKIYWTDEISSVTYRVGKKEYINSKSSHVKISIKPANKEEYEEPLENIELQETLINSTSQTILIYIFNKFKQRIYSYMICKGDSNKGIIEISEFRKFTFLIKKTINEYKTRKMKQYVRSLSNLIQSLKDIFNWILFYFFGKILGFYSLYKLLMTMKNYFLSDYKDINIMLNQEMINIIDKLLNLSYAILRYDHESLVYNILEQYFSLLLVGILLLVNMRSFLNTIHFLYTRAIKKFYATNTYLETLLMTYFLGMFYATSCFFIIFSLPKTYRYD